MTPLREGEIIDLNDEGVVIDLEYGEQSPSSSEDCYIIEDPEPAPLIQQENAQPRRRSRSLTFVGITEDDITSKQSIPPSIDRFDSERSSRTFTPYGKEILIHWDTVTGPPRNRVTDHGHKVLTTTELRLSTLYDELAHETGLLLKPGMTVELLGQVYLKIEVILTLAQERCAILGGIVLYKTGQSHSAAAQSLLAYDDLFLPLLLPQETNQVAMAFNTLSGVSVSAKEQLLRYFPSSAVDRGRTLVITNAKLQSSERSEALICRWKLFSIYPVSTTKATLHRITRIVAIRGSECSPQCRIQDDDIMEDWRGATIRGGSARGVLVKEFDRRCEELQQARVAASFHNPRFARTLIPRPYRHEVAPLIRNFHGQLWHTTLILDEVKDCQFTTCGRITHDSANTDPQWKKTSGPLHVIEGVRYQRYTFADVCCGCGGAARAADDAGLAVLWAIDCDDAACQSFEANHPAARIACALVEDVAQDPSYGELGCDIMHLSLPCQYYSPAHTREGVNDAQNIAAMGAIELILQRAKPRVVTFENTFGLSITRKHFDYFRWALLQFTKMNYTVEARTINFADYGVPQSRRRLIIIASCPGMKHPGFPKPTHCHPRLVQQCGRKPWVTASEAVDGLLPPGWKQHDPMPLPARNVAGRRMGKPDDLALTLTTSGAMSLYHWNVQTRDSASGRTIQGAREYTIAELLLLQQFPVYHDFGHGQSKTTMQKQVGNAVPPAAFKIIYDHIRRHLQQEDGIQETIVLE